MNGWSQEREDIQLNFLHGKQIGYVYDGCDEGGSVGRNRAAHTSAHGIYVYLYISRQLCDMRHAIWWCLNGQSCIWPSFSIACVPNVRSIISFSVTFKRHFHHYKWHGKSDAWCAAGWWCRRCCWPFRNWKNFRCIPSSRMAWHPITSSSTANLYPFWNRRICNPDWWCVCVCGLTIFASGWVAECMSENMRAKVVAYKLSCNLSTNLFRMNEGWPNV